MKRWLIGLMLIFLPFAATAEVIIPRIDFENASIVDIVAALGKSSGCSLIFAGDPAALQGKRATIHLKDVPLEEALGTILSTNGPCFEKQGEAYLISSLPRERFRLERGQGLACQDRLAAAADLDRKQDR